VPWSAGAGIILSFPPEFAVELEHSNNAPRTSNAVVASVRRVTNDDSSPIVITGSAAEGQYGDV